MESPMMYPATQLNKEKGFAMLFTVLIVSLILTIAVSISNLTLRQTILSSLAKDSQIAFYQADAALECGMEQDVTIGSVPLGATTATAVQAFECGKSKMLIDLAQSSTDYFVYLQDLADQTQPCMKVIFDKTAAAIGGVSKVQGYGYNVCDQANPRQVERAIEVKY